MNQLANILECGMLIAFGLAWPANIRNSLKVKSSISKSVHFLIIVIVGYLFGLGAKIAAGAVNYVAFFYLLNLLMVSFDLYLYYYYRRLDRLKKMAKTP
ncbi:MAG: hypothetical protein LBI10_01170 [Deltaproteobacteria bacterium]|jgi:hypothetical protein|nr:hypothetical protein [Deltaproteobacteria bacterium]